MSARLSIIGWFQVFSDIHKVCPYTGSGRSFDQMLRLLVIVLVLAIYFY